MRLSNSLRNYLKTPRLTHMPPGSRSTFLAPRGVHLQAITAVLSPVSLCSDPVATHGHCWVLHSPGHRGRSFTRLGCWPSRVSWSFGLALRFSGLLCCPACRA